MPAEPYHLASQGMSLGAFGQAEVEAGLATGRFAGTVLSWREGEAAWVPLASRVEFGAARSAYVSLQPVTSPDFELGAGVFAKGFFGRWIRTWVGVLFRPSVTFPPFSEGGRIGRALIWLLLAAALAVPGLFFFGQSGLTAFLRAIGKAAEVRTDALNLTYLGKALFCLPLWVAGLAALLTLAWHVVLRVFGGGAAGWRTTFRVIAYLGGAWLLGCVAWFLVASRLTSGGLASGGTPYLAALTYFVLLARALALAHVDPGWKPGLAILAVLVLGCCTGGLAIVAALVPFSTPLGG